MKKHVTPLFSLVLIVITLFTGCAQQPVMTASDDPAQLTQLASDVLSQAAYVNSIFNQCTALGGEAEIEAVTVQQNWIYNNWPAIIAADHYYTTQLRSQTINYRGKTIALPAVLLSYNAQQRAIDELNLRQRTPTNQQKTCVRRLQAITQQDVELVQGEQADVDLQALQQQYTGNTTTIVPVPTLAGAVTAQQDNGRSYFMLFEEFKKECPGGQFIVLHNQWPQEAYGSYCKGVPVSLITCEWGKCTAQPQSPI